MFTVDFDDFCYKFIHAGKYNYAPCELILELQDIVKWMAKELQWKSPEASKTWVIEYKLLLSKYVLDYIGTHNMSTEEKWVKAMKHVYESLCINSDALFTLPQYQPEIVSLAIS